MHVANPATFAPSVCCCVSLVVLLTFTLVDVQSIVGVPRSFGANSNSHPVNSNTLHTFNYWTATVLGEPIVVNMCLGIQIGEESSSSNLESNHTCQQSPWLVAHGIGTQHLPVASQKRSHCQSLSLRQPNPLQYNNTPLLLHGLLACGVDHHWKAGTS
jgi:hypothetical protein